MDDGKRYIPVVGMRGFAAMILLWLVYFFSARLGLILASINQNVSPVWPATGIAICGLFVFGKRFWPAIFAGAFLANHLAGSPLLANSLIALGNTSEALIGALILEWFVIRRKQIPFQFNAIASLVASIFASAVSATIGNMALVQAQIVKWHGFGSSWLTWWIGDFLGGLCIIPLVLIISRSKVPVLNRVYAGRVLIKLAVLAFVGISSAFVFYISSSAVLGFTLLSLLLLVALKFDQLLTMLSALVISVVGVVVTMSSHGPFSGGSLNDNLIHLQLFLAAIAITATMLPELFKTTSRWIPLTTLIVGWLIAGAISANFEWIEVQKDEAHFQQLVKSAETGIAERLSDYEDALRAGSSLYNASKYVSSEEWRNFTSELQLVEKHPGINGMGVIFAVKPEAITAFEEKLQKLEFPEFKVHIPKVPQPSNQVAISSEHFVITYIEPLAKNKAALGLDVASELHRREAAEIARDSGQITATNSIVLVQDSKRRPGFLLYLPFYHGDPVSADVADHRRRFRGWIYAPFITERFFNDILRGMSKEVEVEIYDSPDSKDPVFSNLISGTESSVFKSSISFAQRRMELNWRRSKSFRSSHDSVGAWAFFCAAIFALLFASIVVTMRETSVRALELAEERTKDIDRLEKINRANTILVHSVPNHGIIRLDKNGIIQSWNDGAKTLTGYAEEDVVGLSFTLIHEEDQFYQMASSDSILHEADEKGEIELQGWQKRKDGSRFFSNAYISPIRDDDGEIIGYSKVFQDLTERMKRDRLEHEALTSLRLAVSASKMGFSYVDIAENTVKYSDELQEILGMPLEHDREIDGKLFFEAVDELYREPLKATIEGFYSGEKEGVDYEYPFYSPTHGRMWIRSVMIASTRDESGRPTAIVAYQQDTTAQRQAREALEESKRELVERNEQLIQATEAKSSFLATMSHEIRTPLNGVLGMADLLSDTELNNDQKGLVRIIQQSGTNLLHLINDILDFSKLEASKVELEKIEFSITQVVEAQVELIYPKAREKGILIQSYISPNVSPGRIGDPGRIAQIILNLLGNAVKFTSDGTVFISVDRVEEHDSSRLRVEVVDTGIGIEEKSIEELFQPFKQVDGSTSRKFGGTGLGLSICRGLVDAMGGHIGVSSTPDLGSTFWFELNLPESKNIKYRLGPPVSGLKVKQVVLAIRSDLVADAAMSYLKSWDLNTTRYKSVGELLEMPSERLFPTKEMSILIADGSDTKLTNTFSKNTRIILLSERSALSEDEKERLSWAHAVVYRPLAQSSLHDAIVSAVFGNSANVTKEPIDIKSEKAAAGKILVAEDNSINQLLVERILKGLGYSCQIAANGYEVLEALERATFDLILMDCQMPEMDGYLATQHIRASERAHASIPIIALTANALSGDEQKCRDAGMDDYISKPVSKANLATVVARWIGKTSKAPLSAAS